MTEDINEQMQGHLAKDLPDMLKTALAKYQKKNKEHHAKCQDYEKNQKACRVAVAHIKDLMNLAQDVKDQLPTDSEDHEDLSAAIKSAMEEVARFRDGENE